jgi:hypothetical protein
MRRFFRFTIRDLLWLTLVAALALGWGVREWEFRAKTERANDRLNQWRLALGGLASTMKLQGWTVRLDFESRQAQILDEKGDALYWARIREHMVGPGGLPARYSATSPFKPPEDVVKLDQAIPPPEETLN